MHGGKYYFLHNTGLQNQYVYYAKDTLYGEDEARVVIDVNEMDKEGTTALNSKKFTKDGSMMAYTISKNGSDWESINVMDMATGKGVEGDSGVSWVKYSDLSWYKDYGFFYCSYKEPSNRPPMDGKAG
jgi:prolyl oligopeptidase